MNKTVQHSARYVVHTTYYAIQYDAHVREHEDDCLRRRKTWYSALEQPGSCYEMKEDLIVIERAPKTYSQGKPWEANRGCDCLQSKDW